MKANPPPPSRLRPWLAQVVLPLAVAAALLAAVLWLGALARAWLRGADEPPAPVRLRALDCPAPPGLDRQGFLDEVLFLAGLPDEADEGVADRLRAALEAHPWVREVRSLELAPKPRAEIYFRVPVLRVSPWDRAVDRDGVLLPKVADDADLFTTKADSARPGGLPGLPCGDRAVSAAASVAGFLLRHRDKLGLAGAAVAVAGNEATLTAKSVKVLWGRPPGEEEAGEPKAAAKLERLLEARPLAGKTRDVRRGHP